MATKMGNENLVVTDPVVEEIAQEDGSYRCVHASGFVTVRPAPEADALAAENAATLEVRAAGNE